MTLSRNDFLQTIPSAIATIITATLCWKYNCTIYLYPIIAASLFFIIKNYFPHKKALFFAVAFFTPVTITVIKRQVAAVAQNKELINKTISIEGVVLNVRPSFDKNISTFCTIYTTKIKHKNKTFYLNKKIHLFLSARTRIKKQQNIRLKDIVVKTPPQGSYREFCIRESIWGTVYATKKDYKLQHTLKSRKPSVFDKISRSLSLKTKILFELIFLGKKDKGYISQNIQHQSLYWGISHIMARSGLHLSIIFLLIFCILTALPIPYQLKLVTTLIFIVLFFISTPYSTSFNRAFLMIITYLLSQIHKVLPNGTHLLSILTLFILLYNPLTCLSLGFQLSFGITYIIIKALSSNTNRKYCFNK